MPEEYISTTLPLSEIAPENLETSVPPPAPEERKKFPWLISILLMLLVFIAAITIYLFTQVRELNTQINPPPSQSPSVVENEVSNWQTFRVDGMELKIPADWVDLQSSCQKIEITKSEPELLEMDIKEYIQQEEGFSELTNLDKVIAEVDKKHIFSFQNVNADDFVILGPLGQGELNNIYLRGPDGSGYYNMKITYVEPLPGEPLDCTGEKESQYQQVLSTIKFSASGNPADYTCPQAEWVDCMPGPDVERHLECSEEYLSWARANCPGFKGAAL